jgi:Cytidylyltransferase-like
LMIGAYPGTFNPPTVAHLAIAEAAWRQGGLDRVDLVLSRSPLGKDPSVPSFQHRLEVLEAVAASRPWLVVTVTDKRLIADVAAGYDAVIMGTDKWVQVCDPAWYGGSIESRDAAVARLPRLFIVERPLVELPIVELPIVERPEFDAVPAPPDTAFRLVVDEGHAGVSSSQARTGRSEWMLPEAVAFDEATGAWSRPDRYLANQYGSGGVPPPGGTTLTSP